MTRLKLLILFLSCLWLTTIEAQESVMVTGGKATGDGSVCYSVGQVVYTTQTGPNGSVIPGLQQPYEISVVTGIEEARKIQLECKAYPNPATEMLYLDVDDYKIQNLEYRLYNLNGILLANEKISSKQTGIQTGNLSSAVYLLLVTDNHAIIKKFKIIKK